MGDGVEQLHRQPPIAVVPERVDDRLTGQRVCDTEADRDRRRAEDDRERGPDQAKGEDRQIDVQQRLEDVVQPCARCPGRRVDALARPDRECDRRADGEGKDERGQREHGEREELSAQELDPAGLADEQIAQRSLAVLGRRRAGEQGEPNDAEQGRDVDDPVHETVRLRQLGDRDPETVAMEAGLDDLDGAVEGEERRNRAEEDHPPEAPDEHRAAVGA